MPTIGGQSHNAMQQYGSAYKQESPFAIQIELAEGCNLRCKFCGLSGIRGKENNFKFLTVSSAECIAHRIKHAGWNSRLEFAMHGEPSANPAMLVILEAFRSILPRHHMMMTSNGMGFMKTPTETVDAALEYLNVLALDWYEGVKIVPRILDSYTGQHTPIHYPRNPEGNPHRRGGIKERRFVIVQDIEKADEGTHSSLNNHAGSGSPPNANGHGKRCAKPFRELSVRWDGNIAICCNDWSGTYKCGNVLETGLEEIWQGAAFMAARKRLVNGDRNFAPCVGCDAVSYRVGLLPDKKGRAVLPPYTPADARAITAATAGAPYTAPVPRPWDRQ